MAFNGTPTITRLGQNLIRITGVSLPGWSNEDPTSSGKIGIGPADPLAPSDIQLPDDFPAADIVAVGDLMSFVEARVVVANPDEGGDIRVAKALTANGGLKIFLRSIGGDSGSLEIYIQLWHSAVR